MRKIAETFCIFLFAALLFSTLNFTAFATEKLYRIQGKILSNLTAKEISDIPVVLLRFDPTITDGPPLIPIQRSETNERGEYSFKKIKKKEGVEYLIGALIQGNRISSNRIQLKDNLQETLNLEYFGIPSLEKNIRYNLEKINYLGNLFVFNLLKNKIRITEVIYLQNASETFISSQKNPLKRKLPKLKNFQTFEIKENLFANFELYLTIQILKLLCLRPLTQSFLKLRGYRFSILVFGSDFVLQPKTSVFASFNSILFRIYFTGLNF